MKKKIAVCALVLVLVSGTSVFAASGGSFGIGGAFGIQPLGGLPSSAMLTFKTSRIPMVVGIGMQLSQDTFNLGLTLDWWLFHQHLVGIIDLYAGPGLFLALPNRFMLGGRIPIGLQIWPLGSSLLELFLEIAPGIMFIDDQAITIPNFLLQGSFGFRFWF